MARQNQETINNPLSEKDSGFSVCNPVRFTNSHESPAESRRQSRLNRLGSCFLPRRGLNIQEVLDAFPEEAKAEIPRQIKRLNKIIKPYNHWVDMLKFKYYDDFTKWFLVEVSKITFAPMAEIKYLRKLKIMRDIMEGKTMNGQITDADIERARSVPITSLIECKKKGGKYWAKCPFHEETRPSMIINTNNTTKCFSCGFFGDVIDFVRKLNNLKFVDAVKYLNKLI